ncbi:MAG: hypothetical protein QOE45_2100 [Frankiaceae bacterium]|jgi:hypothetical protein|nr:hypothetical protein [Frankiaceae bacterium]
MSGKRLRSRIWGLAVVIAVFAFLPATAGATQIASVFNTGLEGWTVSGDAASGSPYWVSTGGNPGGYMQAVDAATGADLLWNAPAKFLGNQGAYYGGKLRFDREVTSVNYIPAYDVTLTGAGTSVHFALATQPATTWTRHTITLLASKTSPPTTEANFRAVLGNLTGLQIEAEYVNGNETDSLDNVVMTTPVPAAPKFTSTAAAKFKVGTAGTFLVKTTGFPTPALSIDETLPAGLTFTDNGDGTGTLGGTPGAGTAGIYDLTVVAANSVGTTTQAFTLTINQLPTFTSATSTTFSRSGPNSFLVTTTGGFPTPVLTETKTLPAGVSFVDNGDGTGTLSGMPTAVAGKYALAFKAANAAGSKSQSFSLNVVN